MNTLRFALPLCGVLLMLITGEHAPAQTPAKQLEQFKKTANEPGDARSRIAEYHDGTAVLNKPGVAEKATFTAMAQYLVNRVTHAEYLLPPDTADLKPKPADKTVSELVNEMRKFLIVPPPDGKLSIAQEDYIRELGTAFKDAFTAILVPEKGKPAPPPIIRVNAGRMLAVACETGAPALWPFVTGLLKSPDTPPELVFYALKSAEGLLGGFDVSRLGRLAATPEESESVFYDLVHTLEVMVEKGPPILGKLHVEGAAQPTLTTDPKSQPASSLAADQVIALRLYRLQAIKALARLRSDTIGGKVKAGSEVRPLHMLARVAIGDPMISPAFNGKEVAEAVIGLSRVNPGPNLNLDELAYAIASGTRAVFSPKAGNYEDASLPWKGTAGRLNAALQDWQTSVAKRASAKQKEAIASLLKKANDGLFVPALNPTTGVGGINPVKLDPLDDWLRDNKPKGDPLFSDAGAQSPYKLNYPANR